MRGNTHMLGAWIVPILVLPDVRQAAHQWPSWDSDEYSSIVILAQAVPQYEDYMHCILTQTNLIDFHHEVPDMGLTELCLLIFRVIKELRARVRTDAHTDAHRAAHKVFVASLHKRLARYKRYIAMGVE